MTNEGEVPIDDLEHGPSSRLPGDFLRVAGSGAPRVLRADGSGKRDTYGRPSNLYSGNTFGLDKWKEQRLLAGLQLMLELGEPIDKAPDVTIRRALELAEASLAAERGTAVHRLLELEPVHRLRDLERAERSVLDRLEELGFAPELVECCRLAYARALDRYGLEVLTNEARCVHDDWRVAGSADTFMRCHDELLFDDGGVIAAGAVVCEDHKTGQLRMQSGRPLYWLHYAAQIAAYAGSQHYAIEEQGGGLEPLEERRPWPWEVSQRSGLILHIDILGMLDTDVMTVRPVRVDLAKGRQLGDYAVAGRELERSVRAFGFDLEPPLVVTVDWPEGGSQLEQLLEASLEAVAEAKVAEPELVEPPVAPDDHQPRQDDAGRPQTAAGPEEGAEAPEELTAQIRAWLQARLDVCGRHPAARDDVARRWPTGLQPLTKHNGHTDEELAAIELLVDRVETAHSLPFGPSRPGSTNGSAGWLDRLTGAFPGSTISNKEHSTT